MELKTFIRDIPDFPAKGIIFRDVTPLLKNPAALQKAIDEMTKILQDMRFDLIVSPEARGFIFGAALAYRLGKGFVPVRKPGKLPYRTVSIEYSLEYGTAQLHMHSDALQQGQRVVIVDDVLATGGTAAAIANLVKNVGGEVTGMCFLIELSYLNPRERLKGYDVRSVLVY
ncbi:MAG: Adenine phosphoribosyltransferase [Thermotoga sp. 50_1627]|uniref:adenine phosphoribosyltransferase n=1 Tax=Pseudothermotoga sp. TaxID=2033661 RepID=UPI00076BFA8C|nr:MAG: Adenine phosphoribosyltransferase [Thermotoga sp. 50_64]KUK24086.1 MAG: Adenine phosphoribosyltransferase [Thermotoga sp. 50_1627]MBC7116516.1 adenine phosphoribosyltransferase [Pseudothermotoga sp.]MDK2923791.1 adenine phosphoribosyltransferase [Pseudothermotoga sp.]HBT39363.1 adenine phosphoribosyltransferase [Pseudothermotoga sp.]